ncbi:MAG TPA: hypothetical protein VG796_30675 [Verrucomicrobiales bacterium]|jgi:hypothetical protein|nr:hypothetical protein [Verrucomicrobiales bacterium]
MNKLLTLGVTAAALLAGAVPASAQGRTVVVLRNRPAAITAESRPAASNGAMRVRSSNYFANRSPRSYGGGYYGGYHGNHYSSIYNRAYSGGYGGPYLRNGYVGGLKNIPHIVIQIPDNFTKARINSFHHHHHISGGGRPSHGGGGGPRGGGGGRK